MDTIENAYAATSGLASPVWPKTAALPRFGTLAEDLSCDVCIIGAGIAGLTTAYLLAEEGVSVAVLDAGQPATGETGRTTAHLSNALDEGYDGLEKEFGTENARLAADSHTAAIDWIQSVIAAENIDCDFEWVNGYLICPLGEDRARLDREIDAAHRAGVPVAWAERAPWKSFDTGGCLLFPRQAQFNPLKYSSALASKILDYGGRIFAGTRVSEVLGGKDALVRTQNGREVRPKHIVIATHVPINDRVTIHTKQAAYRTYVIAARTKARSASHALYWDTLDPNHYIRFSKDAGGELILVGGEDHKTGQMTELDRPFANLERWARERFPDIENIAYRWSGQIIRSMDGLAFIGRNPLDERNVYIATGYCGNGMTHGTIAGLLITDLIRSRPNPWADLYDPRRKTLTAATRYIKENLNVLPQYLDWLTAGTVCAAQDIPCGSGAILREGARKLAVYRGCDGDLHAFSAVCPHLGGVVHWNPDEMTWDCPCHGSRFAPEGKVLNGPANFNLRPLNIPETAAAAKIEEKSHDK